jgi:hypothetical protein
MDSDIEPKLAPPGAGLPKPEFWITRLLFAARRLTGNRESFTTSFQRERETIRGLVNSVDAESAARRVLIRRPRGLEDSSRYWSVWMTLDHLRIVHGSIIGVIGAFTKGVVPPGEASTARVKPSPEVTANVIGEYEKSCDELLSLVASVQDLNTKARYAHPWFGPLNAAGWQALSASHLTIHRVQIERIVAGLRTRVG